MSSDLTWLPLSLRKNLVMPKVIFLDPEGHNYGGYYIPGGNSLHIVESDEDHVGSTIAHEFCHHVQYENGYEFESSLGVLKNLTEKYSYNRMIRLYFRTQPSEMEALIWQHKLSPSPVSEFWWKALVCPSDKQFDENVCM